MSQHLLLSFKSQTYLVKGADSITDMNPRASFFSTDVENVGRRTELECAWDTANWSARVYVYDISV